MTDRVESAERLLATLVAGRAHVRALALSHLPAGRAFSMELRATGLLPAGPRPPAAARPPAVAVAIHEPGVARPAVPVPATARPAAPEPPAPTAHPASDAVEAATAPLESPATPPEPVALGPVDPPVPDSPETEPDEATQIMQVDDALREAIAAAAQGRTTPAIEAASELSAPVAPLEDEYTSDEDTDPGPLLTTSSLQPDPASISDVPEARFLPRASADPPGEEEEWAPRAAQYIGHPLSQDGDSVELAATEAPLPDLPSTDDPELEAPEATPEEEESASFEQTLVQPSPFAGAAAGLDLENASFEEESGSLENTILQGDADLFADRLDPMAGWDADDEDSIVDEAVIGGMSWGDDPVASARDEAFEATLRPLDPEPEAPAAPIIEPEDERTRILSADSALLDAIHAADGQAAAPQELEDDFELSADQLQWGDAHVELQSEPVSIPHAEPEAVADDLHWGNDSGAGWSVDDFPGEDLSDTPAVEGDLLSDDSGMDDAAEDDLLPRVDTRAAEPIDQAPTDTAQLDPEEAGFADDMDDGEADIAHLPDVLEDDPLSRPPRPAPSRPAPEPAPMLSVPRVVEPRSSDALEEPTGAAAIQILGVGKAQTLTPTLELGGAEDEADSASFPVLPAPREASDGFSLQFEEPEEESTGPHIPVLTEDVAVHHQPAVLSPDGVIVPSNSRGTGARLAASEADRFLGQAKAAEQKGNLRDAVVHYDDLLSHDPHNLDGHLGRGRCLVDLGDYGSAMSDFTRAEDIAPDSPEPLVEMGNLFFARKEYKRAITYYNHALDLDNRHAMAFSRRGISYYHRKMYAEAHNDLIEAERQDASIPGLQRYIQVTSRKLKKRR